MPPAADAAELLLLRHGQSTWNAEGRWQGQEDPPLSSLGEQQAVDAAAHLRDARLSAVVSSTLQRARRTAELIADALGLGEMVLEPRLVERNFGEFQGLTITEILERWPDLFDAAGKLVAVPPGAEEVEAVVDRTLAALRDVASRAAGRRALVVTHGGVIRRLDDSLGAAVPPTTPNLAGRWWTVDAAGALVAGDVVVPVEPTIVTAPTTE